MHPKILLHLRYRWKSRDTQREVMFVKTCDINVQKKKDQFSHFILEKVYITETHFLWS